MLKLKIQEFSLSTSGDFCHRWFFYFSGHSIFNGTLYSHFSWTVTGESVTTLPKRSRGRPKRKPDYDKDQHVQGLIQQAVELFRYPYDDREKRPADAPTIAYVAGEMHTTLNHETRVCYNSTSGVEPEKKVPLVPMWEGFQAFPVVL